MSKTASAVWNEMSATKNPLLQRCERYAALTIPKLCLREGFIPETTDQSHDYQSLGAQCVNHAANKLMMTLFRPSIPFMRLAVVGDTLKELQAGGLDITTLAEALSTKEREAVRLLDSRAQRPKLYTACKHLIVTGNVLLDLTKKQARVMGLRYYCVRRTIDGKINTLIIKESIRRDELAVEVQKVLQKRYANDTKVDHLKWISRNEDGSYRLTQWVNDQKLPEQFDGKYPENKLPYHAIAWDLADESDYGTGLVEEYVGDLEAISVMAEGTVTGGVLAAEWRWLVNPTGMTQPQDLENSKNGDALPGRPEDVSPTQGGTADAIRVLLEVGTRWEQRLARGFLLLSAVRRDAERVTAEELRQDALELETAWGGVYSSLGESMQKPVAFWLLDDIGLDINGTDIEVSVVTGLDALSRNGDLNNLQIALRALGETAQLPESMQARLKWDALSAYVGAGTGIDLKPFVMSDAEYAQAQQNAQQQRVAEESAIAGGQAAAQQGTAA